MNPNVKTVIAGAAMLAVGLAAGCVATAGGLKY